jgi:hypothetical protein
LASSSPDLSVPFDTTLRPGEIDILETINLMQSNQYALHTTEGCTQATGITQTGHTNSPNCTSSSQNGSGCTVLEANDASVGAAFAAGGGGVYACAFLDTGINIWFFPRSAVPQELSGNASTVDPSTWGTPSASFPSSSCDITSHFGPQVLNLDISAHPRKNSVPKAFS